MPPSILYKILYEKSSKIHYANKFEKIGNHLILLKLPLSFFTIMGSTLNYLYYIIGYSINQSIFFIYPAAPES